MAIARATYPSVMAAPRYSIARATSQSTVTCRTRATSGPAPAGAIANESSISTVRRPACRSRVTRVSGLSWSGGASNIRGHPPLALASHPRRHNSSTDAAQSTWVSPRRIDADPSAKGIVFGMICSVLAGLDRRPLARRPFGGALHHSRRSDWRQKTSERRPRSDSLSNSDDRCRGRAPETMSCPGPTPVSTSLNRSSMN